MTQKQFDFGNDKSKSFTRKDDFFNSTKPQQKPVPAIKKGPTVISVTQATRLLKHVINENMPSRIMVSGEISNFKPHGTGHLYFTLKDSDTAMPAVMWKSDAARLKFKPADGLSVIATGRIDIYEPQGKYQFYVNKLEPSGAGALELALRQLAEKLRAEGIFDNKHKKTLPKYPATIAIVTSDTGAAIEDITRTLSRRWPIARKLLFPVQVQGATAARQIADAIQQLNSREKEFGKIDVMIVGRGGGSLEDLWAFNEEVVARAIFNSTIPIISAVGHEIDNSISDFVADVRAATPTAAAELAVPVIDDVIDWLSGNKNRLTNSIARNLTETRLKINRLADRPVFARPTERINNQQQLLDEKLEVLYHTTVNRLHRHRQLLQHKTDTLKKIEPHAAIATASVKLNDKLQALQMSFSRRLQRDSQKLNELSNKHHRIDPTEKVQRNKLNLEQLDQRLNRGFDVSMNIQNRKLSHLAQHLRALDPRAVLNRGYSITRKADGTIIKSPDQAQIDDLIVTELADNKKITSKVTE
ncbi:MAG: exodeoxyribonuclease VII large subunit [Phycisphaerae bacterium]|nr:exodeoxyribonuclease VII large subunit [Phycisphaerae bacterium]